MKLGPYLSPCTNINSKYMKSDQAFWNFVAKKLVGEFKRKNNIPWQIILTLLNTYLREI